MLPTYPGCRTIEFIEEMKHFSQLSPDWQHWIHDNLSRGCSQSSLVEAMV
jgi:hypothetical protein